MITAEFELLASLRGRLDGDAPDVPVGVGDDGAVVRIGDEAVVVVVDAMVDGVHVDRTWSTPGDLGWKALAVNLSDVAAMGADPIAAVVALQRPDDVDDDEVLAMYDGMRELADATDVRLVGGDTVDGPVLSLTVTVVGRLLRPDGALRRNSAEEGDLVAVVGPLGLAAAGLLAHRAGLDELLRAEPDLGRAHRRPTPLLAAGSALASAGVRTAIDVSDGLGRDLGHVAAASGVGVRLDRARLPRHAGVEAVAEALGLDAVDLVVGGGDDYALALTLPSELLAPTDRALEASGLRLRVVGEVVAQHRGTVRLHTADEPPRDVTRLGWQHGEDH